MKDSGPAEQLELRLRQIEADKSGSYDPRTEHLDDQGNTIFINRLILEDSPYLLQHAHNPVDWYAWGNEAFETASAENKPIFLSIGYSTCHWCHVMEVESFDNVEVAKVLNKDFISIKMDREQYPDIDEIYMTGVQLMSGQGGWPMSNFLLANGKAFFGATYFPAASFIHLLHQIADSWQNKYRELESSAVKLSQSIDRLLSDRKAAVSLDSTIIEDTLQTLFQREDRSFGGLAGAPKFPQEPLILLLLDWAGRTRDLNAIGFVERVLDNMARGGIYDQVAGGFHRYSVDAQWLVPHFEKMLYNQSQLGLVYLEAFQLTRNSFFSRICAQTLNYVVAELQLPEGGFYSATDADSEGTEGVFFVWTIEQLEAVLERSELEFVVSVYGLTQSGNFEGSNILYLKKSLDQYASEFEGSDFYDQLDRILNKIYKVREQRIHPLRDDKLIVAWTGAMITTLAKAAYEFENESWLQAAEQAAELVCSQNIDDSGQLHRIYLAGTVSIAGQLEDYANFSQALLTLFDVTGKSDYLQQAAQLMQTALVEFWDDGQGGFFLSPKQQIGPPLIRSRNASDGATLSPVATALQCLVMLRHRSARIAVKDERLTFSELTYREKIDACIDSLSANINDNPLSHPSLLRVIATHQQGEGSLIQYAGNGIARVSVGKAEGKNESLKKIEIHIALQAGWHVTAAQATSGNFVAIELKLSEHETHWRIRQPHYPTANANLKDADGGDIAIYESDFSVEAEIEHTDLSADQLSATAAIELRLQLCNAETCLLPTILKFRI